MNYQHLYYPNKHITEEQFMRLPLTERINWKKVWENNAAQEDEDEVGISVNDAITFLSSDFDDDTDTTSDEPFEGFGGGDGEGGGADGDW